MTMEVVEGCDDMTNMVEFTNVDLNLFDWNNGSNKDELDSHTKNVYLQQSTMVKWWKLMIQL